MQANASCSSSFSSSDAVVALPSLFRCFRAPSQSTIMRKRRIQVNSCARKKAVCLMNPKGVSVVQRVNEFLDEILINSQTVGKLFCSACWEELSLKLSIVKNI